MVCTAMLPKIRQVNGSCSMLACIYMQTANCNLETRCSTAKGECQGSASRSNNATLHPELSMQTAATL